MGIYNLNRVNILLFTIKICYTVYYTTWRYYNIDGDDGRSRAGDNLNYFLYYTYKGASEMLMFIHVVTIARILKSI